MMSPLSFDSRHRRLSLLSLLGVREKRKKNYRHHELKGIRETFCMENSYCEVCECFAISNTNTHMRYEMAF